MKDLSTNLNWISGKEYSYDTLGRRRNGGVRTVLDFVATFTGIKNLTLAANVDYGWEYNEAFLKSVATRSDSDANWWGYAGYIAYDWTEKLRTAFRGEFFTDPTGALHYLFSSLTTRHWLPGSRGGRELPAAAFLFRVAAILSSADRAAGSVGRSPEVELPKSLISRGRSMAPRLP